MSVRQRLSGLVLLVAAALLVFGALPAGADSGVTDKTPQKGANNLQISKVDATNEKAVNVHFTWNGDVSQLETLTLRQNGTQVEAGPPKLEREVGAKRAAVIVLDQSGSMVTNGGMATTVSKMKEMIEEAPDSDQFGIVTFGSTAVVAQDMTADKETLYKALDAIKPADKNAHTAMWDGVVSGTAILDKLPDYDHNLILVTDGKDDSSMATAAQARGDVIGSGNGSGATVFAMGITQEGQLDEEGLSKLVASAGGRFFVTDDATNIAAAFDETMTALKNQYIVTFEPLPNSQGNQDLSLTVGGYTANASFTVGTVKTGASALAQLPVSSPTGPAFLRTTGGLVLALLLVGIAMAIAAYVIIQLITSRKSALDAALTPYTEGFTPTGGDDDEGGGLSQNALLQRAVAMTEGFAERQGFLDTVEHKLEVAEIPLKAAEVLLIWVAGLLAVTAIGFVLGGWIVAIVALVVGILAGPAFLDMKARMRQRKFETQLPDMLTLMAGALRAGFSLMQAVDAVSQEVQDPMGKELRRVVSESRLGRDLEDALDDTAVRTGSEDFAWAVMAIRIQREVGGNLAELLLTVAETMVQRERLRREVKALTAEGRISAIVLAILPPGLAVIMYVVNQEYMEPLFHEVLGQVMLGLSVIGMVVGYLWMRKVVQIDV